MSRRAEASGFVHFGARKNVSISLEAFTICYPARALLRRLKPFFRFSFHFGTASSAFLENHSSGACTILHAIAEKPFMNKKVFLFESRFSLSLPPPVKKASESVERPEICLDVSILIETKLAPFRVRSRISRFARRRAELSKSNPR
jgi:hypothetical protein